MIGTSPAMLTLKEEMRRIGPFHSKVLITGESGVGKELVARQIHAQSPRSARPFVAVNCAGLRETLLESELFGHVKGSFTGAYRDKRGKFELADQGTVFLDEIGEMTLRMQGLLLRFLEASELQKVGLSQVLRTVNTRVITATNRRRGEMERDPARARSFFCGSVFLGCAVGVETSVGDLQRLGKKLADQWQAVEHGHCRGSGMAVR